MGRSTAPTPETSTLEPALACDITICSDDVVERDPHTEWGYAPGDGKGLVYQELMGTKRAAYHLYTGEPIDAQTMLRYGMVNEVVPRDRLLPRAWEIAHRIAAMPDTAVHLTKAIVKRPWTQRLVRDAGFHVSHEFFGMLDDKSGFDRQIRSLYRSVDIQDELRSGE